MNETPEPHTPPIHEGRYRFQWIPKGEQPAMPIGSWVSVTGDELPMPVWLRIHQSVDGRFVITGLQLGEESPAPNEITSQTLRQIRLREIMADLFKDYDPETPLDPRKFETLIGAVAKANAEAAGLVAKRVPRGPDDAALRAFADTYRTELARQPQRAMTAAAKAHNISRATAHRWAVECRKRGLLPDPKGTPDGEGTDQAGDAG